MELTVAGETIVLPEEAWVTIGVHPATREEFTHEVGRLLAIDTLGPIQSGEARDHAWVRREGSRVTYYVFDPARTQPPSPRLERIDREVRRLSSLRPIHEEMDV